MNPIFMTPLTHNEKHIHYQFVLSPVVYSYDSIIIQSILVIYCDNYFFNYVQLKRYSYGMTCP